MTNSEHKFDTERPDLYNDKDNLTTFKRLQQIADMGMEEMGTASFGVRGVVSGLYIENVWNMNDTEWDGHIQWMSELINENKSLKS